MKIQKFSHKKKYLNRSSIYKMGVILLWPQYFKWFMLLFQEGPPPYTYDNLGYTAHPYDVPQDLDANGQQTTSFNQPPVG